METALDTRMHGFDTIVAVTQNNINSHFESLFGLDDGIKKKIDIGNRRLGYLKATMEAPTVRLSVKDEPSAIKFILTLRTGELQYFKSDDSDDLTKQSIKNWKIALKVKLNIKDIGLNSVPQGIKDAVVRRLNVRTIDPTIFSFRQLFMYFQSKLNIDEYQTEFPPELAADPKQPHLLKDHGMQSALNALLNHYIQAGETQGDYVLGYSITVVNPNIVPVKTPTFPPTDVAFAVNAFKDGPVPSGDPGAIDTLNYLMMTDMRPWPMDNPTLTHPWFGNWVTSDDEYGVIAVARSLFVEKYLVPELAKALTMKNWLRLFDGKETGLVAWVYKASISSNVGQGEFVSDSTKPGTYLYKFRSEEPIEIGGTGWTQRDKWAISHEATITIPPGGKTVEIRGGTKVRADCVHWHGAPDSVVTAHTNWWNERSASWSLTLSLGSVTLGALQLTLEPTAEEFKKKFKASVTSSEDGDWFYKANNWLSDLFGVVASNFDNTAEIMLGQIYGNSTDLIARVQNRLNNMNMFVFPGGREFKMRDPQFNNELDLIVKTEYEFY